MDESNVAEGELTIEECSKSVFQMKLNKAPGIDGLTVEFYRTFWPFLKHFAVKVFNNCYVKEELSNMPNYSFEYRHQNNSIHLICRKLVSFH